MNNLSSQRILFHAITLIFFTQILVSCSIQKKVSRSAEDLILNTPWLKSAHVGISIFEPATHQTWFDHQGDRYFVPASNTKIPTCYIAMKYLGDSLVGIRYSMEDDSTIRIQPSGDPTFLLAEFRRQPVLDHLRKFRSIIISTPLYDDFLGNGWSWNDYQEAYMAQRSDMPIYGNVSRFTWQNSNIVSVSPSFFGRELNANNVNFPDGFEVFKSWDRNDFSLANGRDKSATVPFNPNIGTIRDLLMDTIKRSVAIDPFSTIKDARIIHSQPVDSMLKPMMYRSDNFFAEQSLLMVSKERLGIMNDARIIDTIMKTDFLDLPQPPRWVDGSGLSRYNLFTPQSMIAILGKMQREFGMDRIKAIFPTGGQGTISSYYKSDSGYIYGKTGTLSGVVAFSGFLYTKKNKLLIFSILVNNHQTSAMNIRKSMERFLQGIRDKY